MSRRMREMSSSWSRSGLGAHCSCSLIRVGTRANSRLPPSALHPSSIITSARYDRLCFSARSQACTSATLLPGIPSSDPGPTRASRRPAALFSFSQICARSGSKRSSCSFGIVLAAFEPRGDEPVPQPVDGGAIVVRHELAVHGGKQVVALGREMQLRAMTLRPGPARGRCLSR